MREEKDQVTAEIAKKLDASHQGKKMLRSSPRKKIRACIVLGMGEESPLYDPGSKLYHWEGESTPRASQEIGWEK